MRDRYLGKETFSPCVLSSPLLLLFLSSSSRRIFPALWAYPLKTRGTTGDTVVARGWSRRSILMGIRGSSARKSDILPRRIAFNCCWVSVAVDRTLFRLFFFLLSRLLSVLFPLQKKNIVPWNYKRFFNIYFICSRSNNRFFRIVKEFYPTSNLYTFVVESFAKQQ